MGKKNGKLFIDIPDSWFDDVREGLAPELEAAAKRVASNIDGKTGVRMQRDRQGRPVAMVTLQEPGGIARQVKNGVMTRAAAQAGLDVKRYTTKGR